MWISFVSTCISTYFFRHMSTSRDNQWKSLRSLRLFPSRASDACHLCEPRFYLHFFQPSCPNLSVTWIPIPVPKGPSSEPRSPKHRAGIRRKKVVSAVDPSENKAVHDQHCFGGWIRIWNMMSWWTSWTTLAVMHWQTAAKPNEIVAIENWKTGKLQSITQILNIPHHHLYMVCGIHHHLSGSLLDAHFPTQPDFIFGGRNLPKHCLTHQCWLQMVALYIIHIHFMIHTHMCI